MANVVLEWNERDLQLFSDRKIEQAVARALLKAGRDAIRTMKVASARAVRFRKRIKLSRVNKVLSVTFPRTKQIQGMEWRLNVANKAIPLADFPHSQTKKGVTVAVNAGKRKLLKSAFEATTKSGHTGIFYRTGKARLPIRQLYSTRVIDVFSDDGMIPAVQEQGMKMFSSTYDRVLPLELDKLTLK